MNGCQICKHENLGLKLERVARTGRVQSDYLYLILKNVFADYNLFYNLPLGSDLRKVVG